MAVGGENKMPAPTNNLEDHWAIVKQELRESKINEHMVEITFVRFRDLQIAHTYVDFANKNVDNWWSIIRNPEHSFVVSNLRFVKGKAHNRYPNEPLIDADSKPEGQAYEFAIVLEEIWERLNKKAILKDFGLWD